MRIVYNTDQIYLHGGIEKVMATKANYFASLPNTKVYVITTEQKGNKPCYELDRRIQLIDLGVNYNRSKSYFSKENLIKTLKHFNVQRKKFKVIKPDVIISPNYNFDHYWLPFIKSNSILIKEKHSSLYSNKEPKALLKIVFNNFCNWIESKYNYIVVLNEDEKKYYKTKNVVVIPNPVIPNKNSAELINKKVIAAGRITPIKGFDKMIETWKLVNDIENTWELHIYGEDYLGTQAILQTKIDSLNLSDKVIFKGSVNNLTKEMLNYSIYLMSSDTECFPMVLLESLSVGLPIVSFDCPNGPRNIIVDNEDGFLTENKNILELSNNILKLSNSYDLRVLMGGKGKENVKRFSLDNVMPLWLNIFTKL